MSVKLPIDWTDLTPEEDAKVKKFCPTWPLNDFVKYPGPVVMPRTFTQIADRLYNMPVRPSDIWIVSFPKTGTTWTQEMTWMLVNDVDIEKGKVQLMERSPFLEVGSIMAGRDMKTMKLYPWVNENTKDLDKLNDYAKINDDISVAEKMVDGRRVIKCHMPIEFLPPKVLETCKVLYVCRNVKDCCVSYFNHNVNITPHDFQGDFNDFATLFKEDLTMYGSYWHHLLGGWKLRNHKNLKFIWFEDMKKDQRGVIESLCDFLEHPLSEEQVSRLVSHLHIDNMKHNPHVALPKNISRAAFIRKGAVGDSKNYFKAEKAEEWNQWITEKTQGTGIQMTI